MQPKIKNATFATQCNPYQNMRYNSESEYIILMGDVFGFAPFELKRNFRYGLHWVAKLNL